MDHRIQAVAEITDKTAGGVATSASAAKAIAASEAFRKYDWLKKVPIKNSVGNMRGMVVSGRWAAVFNFADDAVKPLEKVAVVASIALNIVKAKPEIDQILASSDDWTIKGSRLSAQVTSISLRTALGIVPTGAHILTLSMSGYLQLGNMMGIPHAGQLNQTLKSMDASLTASFDKTTDGNNIYWFVTQHLTRK